MTLESSSLAPPSKKDSLASHYALGVLLIAYILSFIDRNIMALLVGPIREDFNISDFQFSLLHGLAFTLFYIVLGLPIGWLADRISRKLIISSGIFFWSLMTSLCGLANNFHSLFLTRIGVGVGEASLSPAAYSLLSDLYSEKNLRWATAIFAMGITIGSGTSYMIGGWLYDTLSAMDLSSYPLIGSMAVWQITFVGIGLPGLVVVVLMLFVSEPRNQKSNNTTKFSPAKSSPTELNSADVIPLKDVIQYLKAHWKAFFSLMGSVSMMAIIGYGTLTWFPEFLVRTYGISKTEAGTALGAIFIFAGTLGTFAGAFFCGLLQKRGYTDANLRLIMIAAVTLIIPATVAPLMPTSTLALTVSAFVIFIHYMHFGVAMAGLQLITPNRMRAQTSALMLFLTNFFGLALGGTIVAALTDFVFNDDNSLRYSLSVISLVFYPIAAAFVAFGLKAYRKIITA
ncbi:MAG: MFS transporter [Pseudomonadales bacterium]|nr:MFS transporter [Pseudomonadales bacterium]